MVAAASLLPTLLPLLLALLLLELHALHLHLHLLLELLVLLSVLLPMLLVLLLELLVPVLLLLVACETVIDQIAQLHPPRSLKLRAIVAACVDATTAQIKPHVCTVRTTFALV
jgi:hypothetical protein